MAVKDIENSFDKFFRKTQRAIQTVGEVTGEKFIRNARQISTYRDRTANLRNSVGYMAQSPVGSVSDANSDAGQAISEVTGEIKDSGLIMVAGMNYAAAVEARGYDVITNSVEQAKADYDNILKRALKT